MKQIKFLILGFLMLLLLVGCSAQMVTTVLNSEVENNDIILLENEDIPDRKIIYEVEVSYDVEDLDEAAALLDSMIEADEWFDREVMQDTTYYFLVRVKTERLDAFIEALSDEYVLIGYQKVGTDISVQYQDMTNRVLSLEAQLARLLVLYNTASLSEMLLINEQMSDIEVELANLQGSLNQFDSLADYSEVNIRFFGRAIVTKSPFFNRIGSAFVDGVEAVISFFDGLFIVLASVIPFAIVFGIPGYFIIVNIKKRRRLSALAEAERKAKN
jgi:hypothetical protein